MYSRYRASRNNCCDSYRKMERFIHDLAESYSIVGNFGEHMAKRPPNDIGKFGNLNYTCTCVNYYWWILNFKQNLQKCQIKTLARVSHCTVYQLNIMCNDP